MFDTFQPPYLYDQSLHILSVIEHLKILQKAARVVLRPAVA